MAAQKFHKNITIPASAGTKTGGVNIITMEKEQFIQQTYRQPFPRESVEKADANPYDEFVWKLARKFTNSDEEAAAAVEEMFTDIRRCAEAGERVSPIEARLTARLAFRRLLKFLQ